MPKSQKSQSKTPIAYLIGIKGVGMTALAQLLKAQGYIVSGSDTHEKFFTDVVLKRHRIKVYEGFDARHVTDLCTPLRLRGAGGVRSAHNSSHPPLVSRGGALVIASSAYSAKNPEVVEAKRCGLKVFSYAEALGKLFNEKEGIAVCGSHGKTTTSALLGYVFQKAGLRPTVVVGSEVMQFQGNALTGRGVHFIAELDEYQNKFRHFNPETILLNNIDYDHPDYFKTPQMYRNVFREFVKKLPKDGLLAACGDDREVRKILPVARSRIVLYGLEVADVQLSNSMELDSAWIARNVRVRRGRWHFDAYKNRKSFGHFALQLPGRHNVLNVLGVIALANAYGISKRMLQKALASFRGTRRRFERIGTYRGALLIDDYAHHPTEIRATLQAARELFPNNRIIAVFHPHTYSRTEALLGEFAKSFGDADKVIVLDIYSSAREKKGRVTSRDIVKRAKMYHKNVRHIPTIPQAVRYLKRHLQRNDVLLTLGAGDVWRVAQDLRRVPFDASPILR